MTTDRTANLSRIDELADEIGWRTGERFLRRLRPYNLNIAQYLVMTILGRSGIAESIRSLCDQLATPASSMTHTIDHLEAEGLVVRAAHPTDRRVNVVRLTTKGEETAIALHRERKEHVTEVFGHLSDDDLDGFARILQTTLTQIDEPAAK